MHKEDVTWLREQIESAERKGRRLLVVTHHAPSLRGTSSPKYARGPLEPAFATDLEHLFVNKAFHVAAWIFGHTHHACELFNGRLVSNPRGYADTPTEVSRFVVNKTLRVWIEQV